MSNTVDSRLTIHDSQSFWKKKPSIIARFAVNYLDILTLFPTIIKIKKVVIKEKIVL